MKVVFGKGVHFGLRPLQQLILHHRFRKLVLPLSHLVHVLLLSEGRLDFLCLQIGPIVITEPGMGFNLLYAALSTQSDRWSAYYQLIHEVSCLYTPAKRDLLLFDEVLLGEDGVSDFDAVVAGVWPLSAWKSTLQSMSSWAIIPMA